MEQKHGATVVGTPAVEEKNGSVLLEMRDIVKEFAGVRVLDGVHFSLESGEVHALVGENGAGKSTLMKILGGVYRAEGGEVLLHGKSQNFTSPRAAAQAGIAIIHQELSLVPTMSVAENLLLGRQPRTAWGSIDYRKMEREALRWLGELDLVLDDVWAAVETLSIGLQQLVEIAKALSWEASVLVMDEPTSALSDQDARRLFETIARLKGKGVGIVYISHKMDEIYRLADRITVLRDGRWIGSAPAAELPHGRMIEWMVGRKVDQFFPERQAGVGDTVLRVEGWTVRDPVTDRKWVDDVSFEVRAGEILGLGGLMGSGASILMESLFGRWGRVEAGRVWVCGRELRRFGPRHSLRQGLALLTNDRKASGLVLPMSVLHNMTIASLRSMLRRGWLNGGAERAAAGPLVERLRIRIRDLEQEVATLSGGNQQKVLLARWLLTNPRVFMLDEPTRGVDVGAKSEIYELMNQWTSEGRGILMITSELPELMAMSDRIVVMHRGRITGTFEAGAATEAAVMSAAMGETLAEKEAGL